MPRHARRSFTTGPPRKSRSTRLHGISFERARHRRHPRRPGKRQRWPFSRRFFFGSKPRPQIREGLPQPS
jgi:hypothetical protein